MNAIDALITWYGTENFYITEANPLMDGLLDVHPTVFLIVKFLLSGLLLLFVAIDNIPKTRIIKALVFSASTIYTSLFMIHGYWLLQFA